MRTIKTNKMRFDKPKFYKTTLDGRDFFLYSDNFVSESELFNSFINTPSIEMGKRFCKEQDTFNILEMTFKDCIYCDCIHIQVENIKTNESVMGISLQVHKEILKNELMNELKKLIQNKKNVPKGALSIEEIKGGELSFLEIDGKELSIYES